MQHENLSWNGEALTAPLHNFVVAVLGFFFRQFYSRCEDSSERS